MGSSNWSTQDSNDNANVQVSGGYVRDQDRSDAERTDFLIFDKTADGGVEKTHLSVDTEGNSTVWGGNQSFQD